LLHATPQQHNVDVTLAPTANFNQYNDSKFAVAPECLRCIPAQGSITVQVM
jgi:hypothetical protein